MSTEIEGGVKVPLALMDLGPYSLGIYAAIRTLMSSHSRYSPELIAAKIGIDLYQLDRHLPPLIAAGWVTVEPSGQYVAHLTRVEVAR